MIYRAINSSSRRASALKPTAPRTEEAVHRRPLVLGCGAGLDGAGKEAPCLSLTLGSEPDSLGQAEPSDRCLQLEKGYVGLGAQSGGGNHEGAEMPRALESGRSQEAQWVLPLPTRAREAHADSLAQDAPERG